MQGTSANGCEDPRCGGDGVVIPGVSPDVGTSRFGACLIRRAGKRVRGMLRAGFPMTGSASVEDFGQAHSFGVSRVAGPQSLTWITGDIRL